MENGGEVSARVQALRDKKQTLIECLARYRRVLGVVVYASLALAIAVPIIIFSFENHRTYYIFIVYALLPITLLPSYLQRVRQYEKNISDIELSLDIEEFDISKEISYAEKTLRLHNNQLQRYYDLNLRQNSWIFGFGIFCILMGFGVILLTFYLITNGPSDATTKLIIGILGGVSAILTNFIAALYLKMNSNVSENLREFHDKLVETHKLLMGNLIAAKIEDQAVKESTYAEMAKEIAKK